MPYQTRAGSLAGRKNVYFKTQNAPQDRGAIKNHKKVNIFDDYQNIDITHHINFNFIRQIVNLNGLKVGGITNQGSFLKNMGIDLRAEILSKKMSFLKKTDLYTRIRRLTHKDEMGELFKVMFVTTKDSNFKTGFNDIKI